MDALHESKQRSISMNTRLAECFARLEPRDGIGLRRVVRQSHSFVERRRPRGQLGTRQRPRHDFAATKLWPRDRAWTTLAWRGRSL